MYRNYGTYITTLSPCTKITVITVYEGTDDSFLAERITKMFAWELASTSWTATASISDTWHAWLDTGELSVTHHTW